MVHVYTLFFHPVVIPQSAEHPGFILLKPNTDPSVCFSLNSPFHKFNYNSQWSARSVSVGSMVTPSRGAGLCESKIAHSLMPPSHQPWGLHRLYIHAPHCVEAVDVMYATRTLFGWRLFITVRAECSERPQGQVMCCCDAA